MEYNLHPPDGDYCLYIKERSSRINSQRSKHKALTAASLRLAAVGLLVLLRTSWAVGSSQNVEHECSRVVW